MIGPMWFGGDYPPLRIEGPGTAPDEPYLFGLGGCRQRIMSPADMPFITSEASDKTGRASGPAFPTAPGQRDGDLELGGAAIRGTRRCPLAGSREAMA